MHQWNVYKTFEQASENAADYISIIIEKCIQDNGVCHVILGGGNTPIPCLQHLALKKLAWGKIHWYLSDERCLPRKNEERNDLMIEEHLWSRISQTNIHRIPAELGAKKGAEVYRHEIQSIEAFDLAFLGIGEDGHTASLFPNNAALKDIHSVIPVYNSPKPPSERISLSVQTLNKTKLKIVLASGKEKAVAIEKIKNGESLPISSIGDIHWFIDEDCLTFL